MKALWFYRRQRGKYRRMKRLLFASPAEVELIRLMKGRAITIDLIRNPRTDFPLTIVTNIGRWFGQENMRREVRIGKYWTDFGNDLQRAIEVDGDQWHKDIVKEQVRDDYIEKFGWRILHIKAGDIFDEPDMVRARVIKFLYHG